MLKKKYPSQFTFQFMEVKIVIYYVYIFTKSLIMFQGQELLFRYTLKKANIFLSTLYIILTYGMGKKIPTQVLTCHLMV